MRQVVVLDSEDRVTLSDQHETMFTLTLTSSDPDPDGVASVSTGLDGPAARALAAALLSAAAELEE